MRRMECEDYEELLEEMEVTYMDRYESKVTSNSNEVSTLGWCPCQGSCSLTCTGSCKYECAAGCKGTCLNGNSNFW